MLLLLLTLSALILVVAALGMSMCRLAALSDRNSALALSEWSGTSTLTDRQAGLPDQPGEQFISDPENESFRATG